jgi:hypothetical protein
MKLGFKKKLEITKADIQRGIPEVHYCPIALCITRTFKVKDDGGIYVDSKVIRIGDYIEVKTPSVAKKFIEEFDNCFDEEDVVDKKLLAKVKPISFDLEL